MSVLSILYVVCIRKRCRLGEVLRVTLPYYQSTGLICAAWNKSWFGLMIMIISGSGCSGIGGGGDGGVGGGCMTAHILRQNVVSQQHQENDLKILQILSYNPMLWALKTNSHHKYR